MEKKKKKTSATIVADSIDERGNRITTYLLTYWKAIHPELLTHRMFSRNAASSRAIPFQKMLKDVQEDPFIPIAWQKDHKGMQGTEYITDAGDIRNNIKTWLWAIDAARENADTLNEDLEVTKQICNRLLEPFQWYTCLVTATEFDNFFELRCPKYEIYAGPENTNEFLCSGNSWKDLMNSNNGLAKDFDTEYITERLQYSKSGAEIHIQALAEAMWDAKNESVPKLLESGEWHIPFGDRIDDEKLLKYAQSIQPFFTYKSTSDSFYVNSIEIPLKLMISSARCARLSYMTFDNEIDYEKDIKLHDQLLESKHFSPFEHCCRAMSNYEYKDFVKGTFEVTHSEPGYEDLGEFPEKALGWCNNFRGFIPYRYLLENK